METSQRNTCAAGLHRPRLLRGEQQLECTTRFATAADFAVCRSFDRYLSDGLLRYKLSAGNLVIAEVGGEPAGYLRLEYLWGHVPYIGLIYIRESLRKRGIGTAMLAFVEQTLRCAGHPAVYSSSQADEPEPQSWHRRCGFVECGIIAGINEGGVGEVFFRKPL